MSKGSFLKIAGQLLLLLFCLSIASGPVPLRAQASDTVQLHQQVEALVKQQNYVQALPILEKLVGVEPDDPQNHFYLGFALIAQSNTMQDSPARRGLRIRARNAFVRAKELGVKQPVVDALIQSLPPDGSMGKTFSSNAEANRLMVEAESHFAKGELNEALQNYQKALQLDSTLYEAALFSGDVYVQQGDFTLAETWYQKAISIDPNREIAYRYSATPFMKQCKYAEARDRYVEAYVSEPYSRFSQAGLVQWAQATKASVGHPKIDIPSNVSFDDKGNVKIDLDSKLLEGTTDGSSAWITYGLTRSLWHKEKFFKKYPSESTYRHSLAEEIDALQSVLAVAREDKKVKTLNPALLKLKKLDDEGLLEAYILMARPDGGIALDYPKYRKENREKLRRYVVNYVLTDGGT